MIRVGLTGGLACGKSFVGRTLEECGFHLVRADDLGHAVLAPDGEAYPSVLEQFGSGVLATDGTIDRGKLAAEVFDKPDRLALLNSLFHPAVIRKQEEFIAEASERDPDGVVVVEAAILIETGSYRRFEKLIVVVCTEEQQIARAMHRDSCTREQALSRLQRQMPLIEKRKYADYIVDTSGSKEDTIRQTRSICDDLRRLTS